MKTELQEGELNKVVKPGRNVLAVPRSLLHIAFELANDYNKQYLTAAQSNYFTKEGDPPYSALDLAQIPRIVVIVDEELGNDEWKLNG